MSYIETDLRPNEYVILSTRLTKLLLVLGIIAALLGINLLTTTPTTSGGNILFFPGLLFLGFGFSSLWTYAFTEFSVTDRRVVRKQGWILKKIDEIYLEKAESVQTEFDLIGFFFGFGTLVITGSGGTKIRSNGIPDPKEVRRAILEGCETKNVQ